MHTPRVSFFITHKRTIAALLFGLAFTTTLAYAVPPLTKYSAGATLDPACAPGDTNCSVSIPVSPWDEVTGGINYAGGNVGIGTTTPSAALDVVGTIRGSNLTITGAAVTVSAPTNLAATQTCDAGCAYVAEGYNHNYRVYAYKNTGTGRIYSATYATLNTDFVDDGSNNGYDITVSWTASPGADGYRILKYDPSYSGYNYGAAYDTTSTSIIDDADSLAFDQPATVTPTTSYSNAATINGTLSLSGPISMNTHTINIDTAANILLGTSTGSGGTGNFFAGTGAGSGVTNRSHNIFIGENAGLNATGQANVNGEAYNIFIGKDAGSSTTGASFSNFIGYQAGYQATNALLSSFFGASAGYQASGAASATFIGAGAGSTATNASISTFIGRNAGFGATNANNSNFIGYQAGYQATSANLSTFNGVEAGYQASNASNSNFLGYRAGYQATSAANSIFIGRQAGLNDTVNNTASYNDATTFANTSILIGHRTSTGGFSNSIAIGAYATNTAANQLVIGSSTRPINTIFIGGGQETTSLGTIAIGNRAGSGVSTASSATFVGQSSGFNVTNGSGVSLFGSGSGAGAGDIQGSTFIGTQAGIYSTDSRQSVFLGNLAGANNQANQGIRRSPRSVIIGYLAGYTTADFALDNTGANNYSILIGYETSTGSFSNSIALGYRATNTASNQFMIGSSTRPIDTTRINGSASTQCTITTGTGIACTSDERLKTDIVDLPSSTLDSLLNVRTITYTWKDNPAAPQQIGFLAQDLEQYFPQLVSTDSLGYKSVYYAQMTPILVEAIREINTKITTISDLTADNSWRTALTEWFASTTNGISRFFAREIHTETICVKKSDGTDVCLDGDQLQGILNGQPMTIVVPPPTPTEEITPTLEPQPQLEQELEPEPQEETVPAEETTPQPAE